MQRWGKSPLVVCVWEEGEGGGGGGVVGGGVFACLKYFSGPK